MEAIKPSLMILPLKLGLWLSKPLNWLGYRLKSFFPRMNDEIDSAGMSFEDYEYISLSIVNLLFYLLLFSSLLISLTYLVQEKPIVESIFTGLGYGCLVSALIGYTLLTYPGIMAGKRAEQINKNLAFALRDLLMQVSSGVPLYNGFVNVSAADYGIVSDEFLQVAKEIQTGTPTEKALVRMVHRNKSEFLKRVIWQLVNTIKAGSSLKTALRSVVNDLTLKQRTQIRDYAHELSLWSLIYMMLAVAVPTIGIVMIILLSTFMGMGIGKSTLIAFVGLCFVIQYVLINLIKSRRPVVQF
jgi:flagellar protein FlaJ